MYTTSDFRNGLKIEIEGEPFIIVDFQHVKPGKGGAFVRTRIKHLETGLVQDRTFRSGEKLSRPDLEEKEMQFLYQDGEEYHFMDTKSYEQSFLTNDQLGDQKFYLKDQMVITVLYHNGRPIGVEVPNFVELEVVQTEPGVKGDTATGATKPATLESGLTINVPLFVNEGESVKIDTRTNQYIERVK
ncbi:elongation factor P [candidate division CSSED10-310 bacterium]|uniref:Elongation factor P n=1 Tax=candidate division CSSED10-310 bacterium TaxID=2855610 RepID=A0ABV6Z417_UNCC1